jgi:hypothetical protein
MDWSTVVILAAITWLDGLRRVPVGAIVLQRALHGTWRVAEDATDPRWQLVSWWSPFTLALVIPSGGIVPDDGAPPQRQTDDGLAERLTRSRSVVAPLRVLGALAILGIVFGIPAAVARSGAWGFVFSLLGVLLLSVVTWIVVTVVMRQSGRSWRRAIGLAAPLLYPFTTPRAAQVVLGDVVAGAPPLLVARRLLGETGFAAWVRPHAYDALRGQANAVDVATLVSLLGRPSLTAIIGSAPAQCEPGEGYCPRCARTYRAGTPTCAHCEGLQLVAA